MVVYGGADAKEMMTRTLLCVLDEPDERLQPVWRSLRSRGRLEPAIWAARPPTLLGIEGPEEALATTEVLDWEVVSDEDLGQRLESIQPTPAAVVVDRWSGRRGRAVAKAAGARGIPVLVAVARTLNEPSPRLPSRLLRTAVDALWVRRFDGFWTTGVLGSQYLRSIGVPPWRIATGLHAVDGDLWRNRLAASITRSSEVRASLPPGPVMLGWLPQDSVDPVLEVAEGFARYCAKGLPGTLVLVGKRPPPAQLTERLRTLDLEARVRFVAEDQAPAWEVYFGAADLFVHWPARERWGTWTTSAMACGVPVVASTNVDAGADLVVTGRTGWLVAPGDADELGQAMVEAIEIAQYPRRCKVVQTHSMKFEAAESALQLEELVERLSERRERQDFTPLWRLAVGEIRNSWGKWVS